MKATKVEVKEGFKPFNITLTIESEEEARALYAIFNHSDNIALFDSDLVEIRQIVGSQYSASAGEMITHSVSYEEFYK